MRFLTTLGFLLLVPTLAYGIMGCLSDEADLVSRSTIIVVGKIESMHQVNLQSCGNQDPPTPGRFYSAHRYLRCGQVPMLRVSITETLRGTVGESIEVLVALPELYLQDCDDRPPVEQMIGWYTVLFAERDVEGAIWSVDGPDSLIPFREQPRPEYLNRIRETLAPTDPK